MARLLEGDVGSGKTVVALSAMLLAAENGGQSVFAAPTEILAEQHYLTFERFLKGLGVQVRAADRPPESRREEKNTGRAGRRENRHSDRHSRRDQRRREVQESAAGGGGRAAPLRRAAARGPAREGRPGRHADHDRHAHPAHPFPGPVRRPGPFRNKGNAAGPQAREDHRGHRGRGFPGRRRRSRHAGARSTSSTRS